MGTSTAFAQSTRSHSKRKTNAITPDPRTTRGDPKVDPLNLNHTSPDALRGVGVGQYSRAVSRRGDRKART
jgi:hypothetical protein